MCNNIWMLQPLSDHQKYGCYTPHLRHEIAGHHLERQACKDFILLAWCMKGVKQALSCECCAGRLNDCMRAGLLTLMKGN